MEKYSWKGNICGSENTNERVVKNKVLQRWVG
jgi:hypothetical protein